MYPFSYRTAVLAGGNVVTVKVTAFFYVQTKADKLYF